MVPRDLIDQIVTAGLYAANGLGRQMPKIIVITDRRLRDQIAVDNCRIGGWKEGFDPFYNAPCILLVIVDREWRNRVYDGSLVIGNMMLAAHALGLGSIWINRAKEELEMPEYQDLLKKLNIPGEFEGIGHCAIGYVDGELPPAAPRRSDRVYYCE